MYCPVEISTTLFTSEMNGIQRKKRVFVAPTMLYSILSLYITKERILEVKFLRILRVIWTISFHYNPCLIFFPITTKNGIQIRTLKINTD